MPRFGFLCYLLALGVASPAISSDAGPQKRLQLEDVFELEWASDPRVSPEGRQIVYVRNSMDVMKDRTSSSLWIIGSDGSGHRALTSGGEKHHSPRWSPDGGRLVYVSSEENSSRIHLRWMDTGQTAVLAHLTHRPKELTWSPDGKSIAFYARVKEPIEPFVTMPPKPEGAEWADPAKVIRSFYYRADGEGFLEPGYDHVFVLPAEGGTPRQLTFGPYHHRGGLAWTPDGNTLVVSANRHPGWEHDPQNTEIYQISLEDGEIRPLTDRKGPDHSPVVSPDGKQVAYLGYDDRSQGYQVTRLYVMNRDGTGARAITTGLDRDVQAPVWSHDGSGVVVQYDDEGNTRLASVSLEGRVTNHVEDLGGTSLGRPYSGGSFSAGGDGGLAFTHSRPDRPADVAVVTPGGEPQRLTSLNEDLLGHKELGAVEEIWYESAYDGRRIQGWIVKPPGFDSGNKYPLLLEIHGGPFANYGDRFSAEIQLYAAAGYVVLYANPRGSTSYGEEFGNLIHHAYPSQDYDDLMSGVDAVIERGYIDPSRLYVTGGSGGGVLTAWIVGKTDRFRAAVSAKPVINWYSFVLTADIYAFFTKDWFPGPPWEHAEHYLARSPISLVGNVTTPTMLLTGEVDYRTPMSESEQFYQALKLRNVDTALVRIPGASHGIANRPSQLIAKVAHILKWFELHEGLETLKVETP